MDTTIESSNENQSEQVDQQIEKRPVGRSKKYFNDDDRKEAIRKQQLATKRRYAQKKAQIYISTSPIIITLVETANLFLIASGFNEINEFIKADGTDHSKEQQQSCLSKDYLSIYNKVGLVEQVQTITQQINKINNAPDVNLSDYYSKSETYARDEVYSKSETDEKLDAKADKTDIIDAYSKSETDEKLDLKADKTDIIDAYSKSETEEKLDLKADKTDIIDAYSKSETYARDEVYIKEETDEKLDDKVSKNELDEYVDLTSAQTITGQKQFGIISVSNISKQSKNDASILLAGGGDMLVSSLVSQPQLQEVRDIASCKSKGYVFATTQEMKTWMEDQENVAKLAIGDNLYIVDKEVMDYWWDGTALRALETELPDMSNVVTSLGAATGNCNAITDISIDGNTITPARNDTFVTTGFDQSITGMKTFTSTIISNGIQYSGYDNSSVFLAGGGMKSISDINASVDLSDCYNKTKTDQLLGEKADATELSNYVTLDTTQSINANKTFNNACRFISTIDGMSTITGQSFVKSGADNTVVLLGAGGTKLISEFTTTIDDSNYVKKDADVQDIQGILRKTTLDQPHPEPTDDDYITLGAVKGEFVSSIYSGSINGNLTATQFIKSGGTDQQLLLENGSTKPLSDFIDSIDSSNFVDKLTDQTNGGNKVFSLEVRAPTFKLPGQSSDYVVISGAMKNKSHFVLTDEVDQTVAGSKTFSNNITAPAFIKSDGTNQQILLANESTKPLSEFGSGSVDDSNYVKKTGQSLQVIKRYIRKNMQDVDDEPSEDDEDYITRGEVARYYVSIYGGIQQIIGTKHFYDAVTANGFKTPNGTNQQVLLAIGDVKPLSEFSGGGGVMSNYVQKTGQTLQVVNGILRKGDDEEEESEDDDDYITRGEYDNKTNNIITSKFYNFYQVTTPPVMFAGYTATQSSLIKINNQMYFFYLVVKPDDTIQAYYGRDICTVNTPPLYTIFCTLNSDYLAMFLNDRYVHFTTQATMKQSSIQRCLFLNYKMSNVYIDEALLDATDLSEFPELYAYIHECESKPIVYGTANQIVVGPQYLQDQVKDNDDKLHVQPAPQTIVPIEIPQVEIFKIFKSQLAANCQMYNPADEYFYFYKLRNKVVYNIGLYLNNEFMGFIFTNFPEEFWPFSKHALVLGDDVGHKQNVMGYISEKGFYLGASIGSVDQVTSIKGNTHIAIAGVYYTDYESLKRATTDVNDDGKINIVDEWHVNSIIDGMKSEQWIQDAVQKQTEVIDDGAQHYDPSMPVSLSIYFNNNTKLVNNNTFGPLRAAYFVKEGPICTFNFQAEVSSYHVNNVFKVFQTIDSDLQPRLAKFFIIKTSITSFAGMIQINGNDTPDFVVNQGFGYYPMDLCDFSGSYLLDPQPQESNQSNNVSNVEPISHIDS
ncbi:MAG: hypothetical protein EZS28_012993, partial [Streblomastix strix]